MQQTGDQHYVKRMNKRIVLDIIKFHSPISRADISAKTGLNKTTVSSLVAELIDEHLVAETGLGESKGGRKPVMLLFRESAGYALGVDLGVYEISAVVADLSGRVARELHVPLQRQDVDYTMSRLEQLVRDAEAGLPDSPYGLVGVGIGVPGIVDPSGIVMQAPNLRWKETPLRQLMSQRLGLPFIVDNEANTGALGEQRLGIGRDCRHLLFVSAGTGIGAGIIIDGRLYRGASGFSGELGHMTIRENGERCLCGNHGCWELYASETALLQRAERLLNGRAVTIEQLIAMADAGDENVRGLFRDFARDVGIGLVNIVNSFNPAKIVIGNKLSLAREWIHEELLAIVQERSLNSHYNHVAIEYAGLGLKASAIGAATLAIQHFFEERF